MATTKTRQTLRILGVQPASSTESRVRPCAGRISGEPCCGSAMRYSDLCPRLDHDNGTPLDELYRASAVAYRRMHDLRSEAIVPFTSDWFRGYVSRR